jgi:hypothetical protein
MRSKSSKANDPMTRAVLTEILEHLRQLHVTGETARIDVRRLPLPADGLEALVAELGRGEVEASMRGVGSCEFLETRISGVWWITQKNAAGDTVGQFIEISFVPDLLRCNPDDIADSISELGDRLIV